jgi:hypothetical protein
MSPNYCKLSLQSVHLGAEVRGVRINRLSQSITDLAIDSVKTLLLGESGLDKIKKWYTISTMIQLYNETMIQFNDEPRD